MQNGHIDKAFAHRARGARFESRLHESSFSSQCRKNPLINNTYISTIEKIPHKEAGEVQRDSSIPATTRDATHHQHQQKLLQRLHLLLSHFFHSPFLCHFR